MNCTCFDLTLEQAANGGLMQAAADCTHKGVMSLEERLKKILFYHIDLSDGLGKDIEQTIPDILQAITDAGYVKLTNVLKDSVTGKQDYYRGDNERLMTGTEWLDTYNRVFKEIIEHEYGPDVDPPKIPQWLIKEAARKASRL